MALRFADPFDAYTSGDVTAWWTQTYGQNSGAERPPTVQVGGGRRGTNSLRFSVGSGGGDSLNATEPASIIVPTAVGACILGFSFTPSGVGSFPTNRNGIDFTPWYGSGASFGTSPGRNAIFMVRLAGATQIALDYASNGTIRLYRDATGSPVLLDSSVDALQWNETYHIAVHAEIHGSMGVVQVWVNGDLWIDVSGVQTSRDGSDPDPGWDEVAIGHVTSGNSGGGVFAGPVVWDYDDLYIIDEDTSDPDNDIAASPGDVAVSWLPPQQDGSHTDWTPLNAGTHFSEVDEIPPDRDTTYNDSDTPGNRDSFVHTGLPINAGQIIAVGAAYMAKRVNAGPSQMQPFLEVGGTPYDLAAPRGTSSTYTYHQGWTTRNPDTTSPWDTTAANAAEPGYLHSS